MSKVEKVDSIKALMVWLADQLETAEAKESAAACRLESARSDSAEIRTAMRVVSAKPNGDSDE